MTRKVPYGGLGSEWQDQLDDGQAHGGRDAQRNGSRSNGYNGYGGDPRGHQDGHEQGNMRRYEAPERFDGERYQMRGRGRGPGGPALPGQSPRDAVPAR